MKRVPIIAANWKMYKTRDEALAYIFQVNQKVLKRDLVESIVCAPAILLNLMVKREGEEIRIAAQNMHHLDEGAFTGENSPLQVKTAGAEYILIGHSERRDLFGETDEIVNQKMHAANRHDLTPILCIGEKLEARESGKANEVVLEQVSKALNSLEEDFVKDVIIAYEPVWAIGTGMTADANQAQDMIHAIRNHLTTLYNKEVAQSVRILYGGSVKVDNIASFLEKEDIDGALIGGAALNPENFIKFTEIANEIKNK